MPTMTISASFEVPDNQREQDRIRAALLAPAESFEEVINLVTKARVTFDMRVRAKRVVSGVVAPNETIPAPTEAPAPKLRAAE